MTPVKQSIPDGEKDCTPFETIVDRFKTYGKASCLWAESAGVGDSHAIVFRTIACTWQKLQPLQVVAFCRNRTVSHWTISTCIYCKFSMNAINSRCLHSFPFNLSRIKFLVTD